MDLRHVLILALVLCAVSVQAKKAPAKKQKANIKLVDAFTGAVARSSAVKGDDHFVIIWQGAQYPATFFWRGENGWLPCKMEKAHKHDHVYTGENSSAGNIHRGDTLLLTPTAGGRFPVPSEIPVTAKNTLYYKTGASKWLSFPIKKIKMATTD